MNAYRLFHVDAFAARPFEGNPAAVVPLDGPEALSDAVMQCVAAENNLSETAFFWPEGEGAFRLRWFTPTTEVDLCGHATLAAAWVAFEKLGFGAQAIHFETRSGRLTVRREGGGFVMDLPALGATDARVSPAMARALGAAPAQAMKTHTLYAFYENEATVAALTPDFAALATALEAERLFAVAAAAPADASAPYDVAARFFAPTKGIPEDPVTGSLWAALAPIWAERLGRADFIGRQISKRGGMVRVSSRGPRSLIGGEVTAYLEGFLRV